MSADKFAKVWDISEDGNGKVKKTLACPGSGGVEDMLVGCLWQNDHLVTVSLGGRISIFSASDLDKDPVSFSGHLKNANSLAVLKSDPKLILTSSFDSLIVKWIQGTGYCGKLEKKVNSQIKSLVAVEGELVSFGFNNKVSRVLKFTLLTCKIYTCSQYRQILSTFIKWSFLIIFQEDYENLQYVFSNIL